MNATSNKLVRYYRETFSVEHLAHLQTKARTTYATAVRYYASFAGTDPVMSSVKPGDVVDYFHYLRTTKGLSDTSAATYCKRVRAVLRGAGHPDFKAQNGISFGEPLPRAEVGSVRFYLDNAYCIQREVADGTQHQLRIAVDSLDRWAGHRVQVSELCDDLLNRWIVAMRDGYHPRVIRNRRNGILAIWRHAAETGMTNERPQHIRPVKQPKRTPVAWELEQLAAMIDATGRIDEYLPNGIHIGKFLEAFVRVQYDTALRTADMLALTFEQFGQDGVIRHMQQKTATEVICRVRPETLAAVRAIATPQRRIVFDWPLSKTTLMYWWKRMLRLAGLPVGRTEGPQKLRRTSASHLESVAPGAASAHLGHTSGDLARKHYLDPTISYREKPLPPQLPKGGTA